MTESQACNSSEIAAITSRRDFTRTCAAQVCCWAVLLSGVAHAASPVQCVVVRKPTPQQREQSAADVERLLDAYEANTGDNTAWPIALAEVFDRFPLPSVNMLMALHHPMWSTAEQRLLAYVEATRQDPSDYAEPASVAQTITRIEQTLLPRVQQLPLLIVEARGVTRRHELAGLDVRIDNQPCTGSAISVGAAHTVSWNAQGSRLLASVTPQKLAAGEDWCIAIDGTAVGPCNGALSPAQTPSTTTAAPKSAHLPPQPYAPVALSRPNPTAPSPSVDYTLAVPGLALAVVGFGMAAYARYEVNSHMDRAEGGPTPQCRDGQCSPSGMADVVSARNWKTTYFAAGTAGLLGLGALIASGHRYYADWLFPSSTHAMHGARLHAPHFVPSLAVYGAGLSIQSHF